AGDDSAAVAHPTPDFGYVVVGWTTSFLPVTTWAAALVMKLDSQGDVVWQRIYGPTGDGPNILNSVLPTADGGYVAVGTYAADPPGGDLWVVKLDGNGTIVWQKAFGGQDPDTASGIVASTDGGYLILGSTRSFGTGSRDQPAWLLKLDANGNVAWQKV